MDPHLQLTLQRSAIIVASAAILTPVLTYGRRFLRGTPGRAVVALCVVYAITFSAMGVLQYRAHRICYYDTGIFDELMWNTTHGKFWHTNALPSVPGRVANYDHAAFVLLLLWPVYWFVPRLETLIIVQTCALAAGAVPIYSMARRRLKLPGVAVCLAAAYLLYVPLQYVNLDAAYNAFRPVALSIPAMLAGLFYADTKRYGPAAVFFGLALMCKEEMAVPVAAVGVYLLLNRGARGFGLGLIVVSVLWCVLAIGVLIPMWRGAQPAYLGPYSHWGSTPSGILLAICTRPLEALAMLGRGDRLAYLLALSAPMGFVCLASPWVCCLAVPTYVYSALSSRVEQCRIFFHYSAPVVPFVVLAAVLGTRRMAKLFRRRTSGVVWTATFVLAAALASNVVESRSPLSTAFLLGDEFGPSLYRKTPHTRALDRVAEQIPRHSSVCASLFLASHFTHQREVYVFPKGWQEADYVLLDRRERWSDREALDPVLSELKSSRRFEVLCDDPAFFFARRLES